MSLETKIEALTQAVIALTAKLETSNVAPVAPVAQVAAPVAAPAPTFVAPTMPAAPSFAPVEVAAPAPVGGAPFTDGKGLIDYVMSAYKALGPAKGASIQAVLTQLGYANINDVKPEHYGSLFSGIEALKA